MRIFGLISLLVTVALGVLFVVSNPAFKGSTADVAQDVEIELDPVVAAHITEKAELITVDDPAPLTVVESPLEISGVARGYWFFEASFPVVLTDWDGKIIVEHYAAAEGEWMTEDFVPFTSTLTFESPYHAGDPEYMRHGTLILRRDNPSGLPEHDDALELPIYFAPADDSAADDYRSMINSAEEAVQLLEQ